MTGINILYAVLTHGTATTGRKYTPIYSLSKTQKKLRNALIPDELKNEIGLVELYIRLCQTDKELRTLLDGVDPLNTYSYIELTPELSEVPEMLEKINSNILGLGLPDIENSASVWDNIRLCLKNLLKALKDG